MRSIPLSTVLFALAAGLSGAAPYRVTDVQLANPDAGWLDGGTAPVHWLVALNDYGHVAVNTGPEIFIVRHKGGVYFLDENQDGINDLIESAGDFSGTTSNQYRSVNAAALSNRGHVAGMAEDYRFQVGRYGVVAHGGQPRRLQTFERSTVTVTGVNAKGEAVGTSGLNACVGGIRAVAWAMGKPVSLGSLCTDSCTCDSIGTGINNRGHAIGNSYSAPQYGTIHAFYWDGTMLDIHSLGSASYSRDINDRDQVVGTYRTRHPDGGEYDRGFLWDKATGMVDLGLGFPGSLDLEANEINNLGQVGGRFQVMDPARPGYTKNVGFLYLPQQAYGLDAGFHDLEALTGLPIDDVIELNDVGQLLVPLRSVGGVLLTPDGVVPPDDEETAGDNPEGGDDGEPVSTLTGELFTDFSDDLRLSGPVPLTFGRYYASDLDGTAIESTLGHNWRHTYDWRLTRDGSSITVRSPTGAGVRFTESGSGWQVTGSPLRHQLIEQTDGFVFVEATTRQLRTFNTSGQLTRIAKLGGDALTLTYAAAGELSTISDGLGRTLTLAYEASGRLKSVTDGTRTAQYAYADGALASFTDALGNTTQYRSLTESSSPGLLASWRLPRGNTPYTQAYDPSGRVTTQTDALGGARRFSYLPGGLTSVADPLGQTMTHTHLDGRLVKVVDANGGEASISYDAQGRRVGVTGKDGASVQFEYDVLSGLLRKETYPGGRVFERAYSSATVDGATLYLPSEVTFPDGAKESFAHDLSGRLVEATDRAGRKVTNTWANGRLASRTYPGGLTIQYQWNADGTLASVGSESGGTLSYSYDALGRRDAVTWPGGATRRLSYDALDRPVSTTDEGGATTRYEWDENGNLVAIINALGQLSRLRYDALDRPIEVVYPRGASSLLRYDAAGKLVELQGPRGEKYGFERDALGLVKRYLDPAGNAWTYTHDPEGRVLSSTDPLGQTVRFGYDGAGRLAKVTDALGVESSLTWSPGGRLTGVEAAARAFQYAYDATGELSSITTPAGASTLVSRDAAGLISSVTDPNGNVWRYERDALGRLSAKVDPLGNRTEVQRDEGGREKELSLPGGGRVQLGYDAAGRLTTRRFSDGVEQRFEYDVIGQRTSANGVALGYDEEGNLTRCNGVQMSYDASSRMKSVVLAPGKEVRYEYDASGLLTRVSDWQGGVTRFEYDAVGRVTKQERPNGAATEWTYDAAGRVVGIRESAGFGTASIALVRDSLGNITEATREVPLAPGVSEPLAAELTAQRGVDAAHRLTAFEFDGLGRQLTDGVRRFVWNLASQLVGIEGQAQASFSYDGLGGLVARSSAGRERKWVWNYGLALPSVVMELEGGEPASYYVHTPAGGLLYSIDARSGARRFHHYDERGSTIFRTDDDGGLIDAWAYDPYGRVLATTSTLDNPFTFAGAFGVIADREPGLYHMRRRVYDSATGRFLSRDPVSNRLHPAKLNPYAYAAGNPVRYIDPEGEDPQNTSPSALLGGATQARLGSVDAIADALTHAPNPAPVESLLNGVSSSVGPTELWVAETMSNASGHFLDASEFVGGRLEGGAQALERSLQVTGFSGGKSTYAEVYDDLDRLASIEGFGRDLQKAANIVSSVTDNVGRAAELVKYQQKTKELLKENTAAQSSNTSSLLSLTDAITEAEQEKRVSHSLAYAWKRELEADFEASVQAATDAYQYGAAAETLETGKNILKSYTSWATGIIADVFESAITRK